MLNAVIDSGDMPLAQSSNLEGVFDVYGEVWDWIKSYYDRYESLPDKDKIARQYGEFEFIKTTGSLKYYIDESHKRVAEFKLASAMKQAAQLLKEYGPYEANNFLMSATTKLVKEQGKVKDTDLSKDFMERVDNLRTRVEAGGQLSTIGIPSCVPPIDYHFGGWQPGDFIVIIGWTGSMKTWLSRLFAIRAWERGYRPLVISLEMNKWQEGYRFDTILTQGNSFRNSQLTHGKDIDPNEYEKWMTETFADKQSFYLVTNEGLDTVDQNMVAAKIEQYNPDLVVLDYHGLFDDADNGKTETDRARNLSKAFKRLAVRNEVPIIDVAQVTMQDGHAERPPELWEVAWSRQIAQDADLCMSVYRQPDSQLLQVVSKKNRRGEMFAFDLAWDIDAGRIEQRYDM